MNTCLGEFEDFKKKQFCGVSFICVYVCVQKDAARCVMKLYLSESDDVKESLLNFKVEMGD